MKTQQIVAAALKELKDKGGLTSLYLVGCGGSLAALHPARYFLQAEMDGLTVDLVNSNEFVHNPPKALNAQSLVVCCSLKATAETVQALHTAHASGAVTIAMTGSMDTLMAKTGKYVLIYSSGDGQDYGESNQATALRLAMELHHQTTGYAHYNQAMDSFSQLTTLVKGAKSSLADLASHFASEYANDSVFYVLGSGPLYYTAYTMACCHLMEMQWKHAVFMHSGEYFHGPFETTEADTPVILFVSGGRTRPVDLRVQRFLSKHSRRHIVIDAMSTGVWSLDANVAEYFEPVIMIPLERHFVYEMSLVRGKDMDLRRYMWREEY